MGDMKTQWTYGMSNQVWGCVQAASLTEARKLARAAMNLRSTRGMWFEQAQDKS